MVDTAEVGHRDRWSTRNGSCPARTTSADAAWRTAVIPIQLVEEGAPPEVVALARGLRQRVRGTITVRPVDFTRGDGEPWRHWAIKVAVSHLQGALVWYAPDSRRVSLQLHDQRLEPQCDLGKFDERRLLPLVAEIVEALRADLAARGVNPSRARPAPPRSPL